MRALNVLLAGNVVSGTHEWLTDLGSLRVDECGDEFELSSMLSRPEQAPDLLILNLEEDAHSILDYLLSLPAQRRPALFVIIPSEEGSMLRHAMQAGARDYLVQPFTEQEFKTSVQKITQELLLSLSSQQAGSGAINSALPQGRITSLMGATSNSDAAFLTSNLSHIMALVGQKKTCVIDLDMQFSALPLFLDLSIERSVLQVLEAEDSIDSIAIDAYMTKHKSGLHVLASLADEVALPGEVAPESMQNIVGIVRQAYEHVYINLPRTIDPLTTGMMEISEQTFIIVDQNIASLRYAKGLITILKNELGFTQKQLTILINQYDEKTGINAADIEKTLACDTPVVIPADWSGVLESENAGIPLYELSKSSAITRALMSLAEQQSGAAFEQKSGLLNRLMSHFGG